MSNDARPLRDRRIPLQFEQQLIATAPAWAASVGGRA